jgi:hypothetical protein
MLTAIDQWIGRKLMQPVIIGLCQRSGMTQYAVARYALMLAMWTLIMRISFEGVGNWLFAVLVIGMSVWETIQAATRPNMPMRSNEPLRKVYRGLSLLQLGSSLGYVCLDRGICEDDYHNSAQAEQNLEPEASAGLIVARSADKPSHCHMFLSRASIGSASEFVPPMPIDSRFKAVRYLVRSYANLMEMRQSPSRNLMRVKLRHRGRLFGPRYGLAQITGKPLGAKANGSRAVVRRICGRPTFACARIWSRYQSTAAGVSSGAHRFRMV